jgi:hypothetical protein
MHSNREKIFEKFQSVNELVVNEFSPISSPTAFLGNLAIKIVLFLFVTSRVLHIEITNLVFVFSKCNYIHSSILVKKCPPLNELESNELSSLPP